MISYILDNIRSLFTDFGGTLAFFLLALPGRLLAISAHEFAHAYVADKCGDPTARMLGRLTLNPLKHLDPIGTLMMLVLGIGWARPVPVNPRNFRNYRRDDLKVSLAGVTMNLIMFVAGFLLSAALVFAAVKPLGHGYGELLRYSASINPEFIAQTLGRIPSYIYQMLQYFTICNISLAVFNLLPIPPLDGYHVLNDLVLHRSLFASPKVTRYAQGALYLLLFTGVLSRVLGTVSGAVLDGMGSLAYGLYSLLNLI